VDKKHKTPLGMPAKRGALFNSFATGSVPIFPVVDVVLFINQLPDLNYMKLFEKSMLNLVMKNAERNYAADHDFRGCW
jgi:hypothetical protein